MCHFDFDKNIIKTLFRSSEAYLVPHQISFHKILKIVDVYIIDVRHDPNFTSGLPLHKKRSFSLRISSVNMTESVGNSGFGHIY